MRREGERGLDLTAMVTSSRDRRGSFWVTICR